MIEPVDDLVRFAAFELDLRTGELRRSGIRISLSDQPFQVLRALLDRPGDLVTREELRQRLWAAETFVDFERGLNAAVRRLRDALGDSADVPRFVETLPRRGYRFIAPVSRQPEPGKPEPLVPEIADEAIPTPEITAVPRPIRTWGPMRIAGMAVVFASLLWAWRAFPTYPASQSPTPDRFMLAVLPFQNMTGDPAQEYISDGMTEELISQLGRLDPSRLGVIARTSVMRFKNTTKAADRIASDLGVSYLLEGSVRTTTDRIGITVRLIETETASQLWAGQYERDVQNLLTLQREVAEAIAGQITTSLGVTRSNASADASRHSAIPEAYEHYLRGRYHLSRDTTDGIHKALEHFQKAIDFDASYALAYTGLADTFASLGNGGFRPMSEAYLQARAAALKALAIDDLLGEAHNSLAVITTEYYWEWADADRHYKRAIELNPNDETALRNYSFYLACMGRHEESIAFIKRSRRLNPVSPVAQFQLAMNLYLARRYDDAIREAAATLDLAPGFGAAHVLLGRVYVAQGMADRAVGELERAHALMGPRPDVITPHAYVLARAGRQLEARAMLDELRRISKPRDPAPIRIAFLHIGLGEIDRAFEWLERAIDARDWQVALLNIEPAFDTLRSDQRFAALVERVGLPRKAHVRR
jgi:TolB-like protein/DNA-binding winged helix-turn-helix (wHTH) protein/Flp pilus assembly protein TadD